MKGIYRKFTPLTIIFLGGFLGTQIYKGKVVGMSLPHCSPDYNGDEIVGYLDAQPRTKLGTSVYLTKKDQNFRKKKARRAIISKSRRQNRK